MEELEALMRLVHLPGLGSVRLRRLMSHFGSASASWRASQKDLAALAIPNGLLNTWQRREQYDSWASDMMYADAAGVALIPYYDRRYPRRLLNISDPPIVLYVLGQLGHLEHNAIAVIGTRHPTAYGLAMAEAFAAALASSHVAVVSGLARGIDTAAHRAALRHGTTVAVLGSGLAMVYPPDNAELAEEIAACGAVVSELPMTTPPDRQRFPQRNRIVSGLSKGVLLIEAPIKSGAMITIRHALEQKKSCFALPGRLDYPSFEGNHRLIKERLVQLATTPKDLLSDLNDLIGWQESTVPASQLTEEERTFMALLPAEELAIDEICRITHLPTSRVAALVMSLHLKALLREYPGKRYKKVAITYG